MGLWLGSTIPCEIKLRAREKCGSETSGSPGSLTATHTRTTREHLWHLSAMYQGEEMQMLPAPGRQLWTDAQQSVPEGTVCPLQAGTKGPLQGAVPGPVIDFLIVFGYMP